MHISLVSNKGNLFIKEIKKKESNMSYNVQDS